MSTRADELHAELLAEQAKLLALSVEYAMAAVEVAELEDQERQELAPAIRRGRAEREKRWQRS